MASPLALSRAGADSMGPQVCAVIRPETTIYETQYIITSSMAQIQLAQLPEAAAKAVAECAEQADTFTFKPLSQTPGVEICDDNPRIRQVCKPVAQSFKSEFWPVRAHP